MPEHFETRQWVPYPVAQVFAFFADPANLPLLTPPGMKMRLEAARLQPPPARAVPAQRLGGAAAGAGSEIRISFRPFPGAPRFCWTARITEFSWDCHFCDEQMRGPFAVFRHRHGFVAELRGGRVGTLVTDAIEFALPGGILGRMAVGLVRGTLVRAFAFRQKRLSEVLAAKAEAAGLSA